VVTDMGHRFLLLEAMTLAEPGCPAGRIPDAGNDPVRPALAQSSSR
jgi:hypothetical protein